MGYEAGRWGKSAPKSLGSWWGTNPQTRQQEEIDIVLEGADGELVIGECKWRNEPVDVDVLDTLVRRGVLLGAPIDRYYLFSKTSFSAACQTKATGMGNVELVALEGMF